MDELVRITETPNGGQAVSARELYSFLTDDESMRKTNRWFKDNIDNNEFAVEGVDYQRIPHKGGNGRMIMDYALSLDFAKELSMQSHCSRGKQARLYFIEAEKKYKQMLSIKSVETLMLKTCEQMSQVMTVMASSIASMDERLKMLEMKPISADEFLTIGQYGARVGRFIPTNKAISYGKECTAYCRNNGIEVKKIETEKYDRPLNAYPVYVLLKFII